MLKLTVTVVAVALAGSASAAGWRSLRIDASSEDAFNESVAALKEKLPRVRRAVFAWALQDIWVQGTNAAAADQREYALSDYLREVDGLGYKEVVVFTDPSGDKADRYWDRAYATLFGPGNPGRVGLQNGQAPGPGDPQYRGPRSGGWYPSRPPREAGQSSFSPRGGEPGVNPWQQ
jgi:hypothetical protein